MSEKLNEKEEAALAEYIASLQTKKRDGGEPVVVAMIGLVGSGKTTVAEALAEQMGATLVRGDAIRRFLREHGAGYDNTRRLGEEGMAHVIKRGGSVVLDSDHVPEKKRASTLARAEKIGARVSFVRVYCDRDVMIERILTADYNGEKGSLYVNASSLATSDLKPAVVRMREMWRRTPHHYRWEDKEGGRWILKDAPCELLADLDTADSSTWHDEIQKIIQK